MKYTPEVITKLEPNQVFVFGSNLRGAHGAGAAKTALKFGAIYGAGVGHFGQTYAIPTKDLYIKTMRLGKIQGYVDTFLDYVRACPSLEFLVTKIGCGLAGYTTTEMAGLFKSKNIPSNVVLPIEFQS